MTVYNNFKFQDNYWAILPNVMPLDPLTKAIRKSTAGKDFALSTLTNSEGDEDQVRNP